MPSGATWAPGCLLVPRGCLLGASWLPPGCFLGEFSQTSDLLGASWVLLGCHLGAFGVPSIHQSINPSINEPSNQPINQTNNQSINHSIDSQELNNQSINPSINHQAINQSIHQSIKQSTTWSITLLDFPINYFLYTLFGVSRWGHFLDGKNNFGLKWVAVGATELLQNGFPSNFEADAMP